MRSLKHLFWVPCWQLVGSVHPPGGLVYFHLKKKKKHLEKSSLPACASRPRNFGVNVAVPDCLCMLKHARVVPQQSHGGGGPWAGALEHSSLAGSAGSWLTSASTRLPSLSHLISLTAATKQIEGTAELTPFHGNVFYCPHPAFYGHYGLCVVHKHTHMSTEICQSRCPLRSLKKHMEASMYFASTSLSRQMMNMVGGYLVVVWLKYAWKSQHCFVAFVCTADAGITISFDEKVSKSLGTLFQPFYNTFRCTEYWQISMGLASFCSMWMLQP